MFQQKSDNLQVLYISIGINCAPLEAGLFLLLLDWYERDFVETEI